MTWSRLIPGGALIVAVVAAVAKSWPALLSGHWAYPALLVVAALVGVALIVWGLRGARPAPGVVRAVFRWLAAAFGVGIAAACWWLAPFPAQATAATAERTSDGIVLDAPGETHRVGIAFIPGALVDPRAYETLFEPIAQAGYPVFIAKPPFGLAFGVPDVVAAARAADPSVQQWVVAGHSLGGAVASGQTTDAAGLILLGAYPINDISDVDGPVLSISGSDDGLSTPADILESKQNLPPDAEFVEIDGGIHAYFGDYGSQPGDGTPSISREEQQAQTQAAIEAFLGGLQLDGS